MKPRLEFVITVHRRIQGVTLSLPGIFGGLRYPDAAAAVRAAYALAGTTEVTIKRETV